MNEFYNGRFALEFSVSMLYIYYQCYITMLYNNLYNNVVSKS